MAVDWHFDGQKISLAYIPYITGRGNSTKKYLGQIIDLVGDDAMRSEAPKEIKQ